MRAGKRAVWLAHFLRADHGHGGDVDDVFHFGAALQDVHGLRQAGVQRADGIGAGQYVCNYEIAQAYTMMGDRDQAFKWLKNGVSQQCDCMIWLQGDPWMEPLRSDPRYLDLIKRVGFDRQPRSSGR